MTIDRQVLKSTAFIDEMIEEGYYVVLLGNSLREIYKVMRGKNVCHRVKVLIYIIHKDHLEYSEAGRLVSHNPDVPVPLPGTWEVVPYRLYPEEDEVERFYEFGAPTPEKSYLINSISGAKLRLVPADFWKVADTTNDHGLWYARTDITENCAEIYFFHNAPDLESDEGTEVEIFDGTCCGNEPKFVGNGQFTDWEEERDRQEIRWEYVHLHRDPRVLNTAAPKKDPYITGAEFSAELVPADIPVDEFGNQQDYLVLYFIPEDEVMMLTIIPL